MFGLSFSELIIIGVIALIVFGPERPPQVLNQLGRVTGELKKTSDSLRREFYNASYLPADESQTLNKTPTLKTEHPSSGTHQHATAPSPETINSQPESGRDDQKDN